MQDIEHTVTPLPASIRLDRAAQLRLLGLAVAALIAAFLLYTVFHALFSHEEAKPPALPPGAFRPTPAQLAQLTIEPVRQGGTIELVRANGAISADGDHSTPILLPYSGQVMAVMVEAGQTVRAGEPVLRVASPELVDARNALNGANAQVAAATEAQKVASANAIRQKAIYESAGGAFKDYNQAQSDLATASSNLRTAQSAARAASDRLAIFGKTPDETRALAGGTASRPVTIYRAPVSGVVADRSVAPGQFVSAGGSTPLLTITDPARVWLVAQLAESDAASVHLGDRVTVTTPALPGRSFVATIDNIGASLDATSHRLPVRATVDNPGGELKPQMFASFVIQRQLTGSGGVLVPARAVIHEGETARVWVAGPRGLLYARSVTTGDTEGGLTRITAGLRPGDRVVTAGAIFVNEAGLD